MTYKSSDDAIATVDANGEVTGVKTGKATITATMTCGTKVFDRTTEVTVKAYELQSVKQTKFDTLEAVVYGDTSGIKPQNVTVTNKETNAVAAVQSVSVDGTDATKVTITTYASLTDGKVYTVTLDGVTKEFTATDGTIAGVSVSPLQITAGAAGTVVRAQLLDKDQVVVEEYKLNDTLPGKVDYSITSGNGYVAGDKLILPEVGNTATAKVTYHTFTYDAAGNDTGLIEKTFTITAVENAATISNWNYTVTKDAAVNWKGTVEVVKELATNDTRYAHFYFVDSNNDDVTNQYSVESSDNSILLLAETSLTDASKVVVTGINAGTAYINVKQNGKVVKSLPVTVKAARKLTDIKFVKNVLYSSIVNGNTITDETYAIGFDQYNEVRKMTLVSGTILSAPSAEQTHVKNTEIGLGTSASYGVISPSAQGFAKGDYLVEVTARDDDYNYVTRTITLKAIDTANIDDSQIVYKMNLSQTEVDLAVASNLTSSDILDVEKTLTIKFVKTKGGAPIATVNADTVTVKNPIGTAVTTGAAIDTLSLNLVTLAGTTVTKDSTYGRMGTYSVQAEYDDGTKVHKFNTSFTLKDTQAKAVVDVKKTTNTDVVTVAGSATLSDVAAKVKAVLGDSNIADFFYDGVKQTVTSAEIVVPSNSGSKLNGRALYIGTVNVQIETTGGLKVTVPVDVNKTFTLDAAS